MKKLYCILMCLVLCLTTAAFPIYAQEAERGFNAFEGDAIVAERFTQDENGNLMQIRILSKAALQQDMRGPAMQRLVYDTFYLTTDYYERIATGKRTGLDRDTVQCENESNGAVTFLCNGVEQAVNPQTACQFIIYRNTSDISVSAKANWSSGNYLLKVDQYM